MIIESFEGPSYMYEVFASLGYKYHCVLCGKTRLFSAPCNHVGKPALGEGEVTKSNYIS